MTEYELTQEARETLLAALDGYYDHDLSYSIEEAEKALSGFHPVAGTGEWTQEDLDGLNRQKAHIQQLYEALQQGQATVSTSATLHPALGRISETDVKQALPVNDHHRLSEAPDQQPPENIRRLQEAIYRALPYGTGDVEAHHWSTAHPQGAEHGHINQWSIGVGELNEEDVHPLVLEEVVVSEEPSGDDQLKLAEVAGYDLWRYDHTQPGNGELMARWDRDEDPHAIANGIDEVYRSHVVPRTDHADTSHQLRNIQQAQQQNLSSGPEAD